MNSLADKIVTSYKEQVEKQLPGLLEALFIYGSVTLNDFHPKKSDIDFVAVCSKRIDDQQFKFLKKIHKKIQGQYSKPNLNGIYLLWEDLGKTTSDIPQFPYFYNGKMFRAGHFEVNPITWFQLKNNSINILEENNKALNFEVDDYELVAYVLNNMQTYWKKWTNEHSKWWSYKSLLLVFFPKLVEWGVLGISRQYFTLKTHEVTSKLEAGKYCLNHLPERFQNILKEAIRIRKQESGMIYPSAWLRWKETIDYMNYILKECDRPVDNFYHKF